MLPKKSAYRRHSDEAEYMYFFIKNDQLQNKINEVWEQSPQEH